MSRFLVPLAALFCALVIGLCLVFLANAQVVVEEYAPDVNTQHTIEEQINVDNARAMLEAFTDGNRDFLIGHLANDVVWDVNGPSNFFRASGRWVGPAEVQQWFDINSALWVTNQFRPTDIWADGRDVIIRGTQNSYAASTGKQFDHNWVMIISFYENLATRVEIFVDTGTLMWSLEP